LGFCQEKMYFCVARPVLEYPGGESLKLVHEKPG
jgi:hypothetical protein